MIHWSIKLLLINRALYCAYYSICLIREDGTYLATIIRLPSNNRKPMSSILPLIAIYWLHHPLTAENQQLLKALHITGYVLLSSSRGLI